MKHSREFVEILEVLVTGDALYVCLTCKAFALIAKGIEGNGQPCEACGGILWDALDGEVSDDAPITRVLIDTERELNPNANLHVRCPDNTGKHSLRSLSGTRTVLRRQAGF